MAEGVPTDPNIVAAENQAVAKSDAALDEVVQAAPVAEPAESIERVTETEPVLDEILSPAEERELRMTQVAEKAIADAVITERTDEEPITAEPGIEVDSAELELPTPDAEPEQPVEATPDNTISYKEYGEEKTVSMEEAQRLLSLASAAKSMHQTAQEERKAIQAERNELANLRAQLAQGQQTMQTPLPVTDGGNSHLPNQDSGSALPSMDTQPPVDLFELFRKAEYEDDAEARQRFNETLLAQQRQVPQQLPQTDVERIAEQKINERMVQQEIANANARVNETYGDFFNDQKRMNYANFEYSQLKQNEPGYSESHYVLQAAANAADIFGFARQKKQEQTIAAKTEAKAKHASVSTLGQSARAVGREVPDETHQSIIAQMKRERQIG